MLVLLRSTRVKKTRKPCRCDGCLRVFPVGSTMLKNVWSDYGLYNWNSCQTCEIVINMMLKEDWPDTFGVTTDEIIEYVLDTYGSFKSADKALLEAME